MVNQVKMLVDCPHEFRVGGCGPVPIVAPLRVCGTPKLCCVDSLTVLLLLLVLLLHPAAESRLFLLKSVACALPPAPTRSPPPISAWLTAGHATCCRGAVLICSPPEAICCHGRPPESLYCATMLRWLSEMISSRSISSTSPVL